MRKGRQGFWPLVAGAVALAAWSGSVTAQEGAKPIPKDSMRVSVPGCSKGYIFTAGPRPSGPSTTLDIPEGTHLRMNGPRKMMADIKAHEGSMIEITGLMKKGQYNDGVSLGGGVRIAPGSPSAAGAPFGDPTAGQLMIDLEGWRPIVGECVKR